MKVFPTPFKIKLHLRQNETKDTKLISFNLKDRVASYICGARNIVIIVMMTIRGIFIMFLLGKITTVAVPNLSNFGDS